MTSLGGALAVAGRWLVAPSLGGALAVAGRWLVASVVRWPIELQRRPRHVGLGSFVCGLAASGWLSTPAALLIATLVVTGVGRVVAVRRPQLSPHRWGMAVWVGVAACLPLGAFVGQQRTHALERTSLTPHFGHDVAGNATVLELPRSDKAGRVSVTVKFRGERVLLRPPPWQSEISSDVGRILQVKGELRSPDLVASARRAHATLLASRVADSGQARGGLSGAIDQIRGRAQRALAQNLPPPQAGLFRGMVLGQDAALPRYVTDDFRASGLSHLVAASGANIALLATLALVAAAVAGIPIRTRLALVLGAIVLYVPLAGAGPSIQRAGIMGAAAIVALLASRPSDRWYALLLAAAGTLLLDPRCLSDPGWQMSFAAVLALLALARPLAQRIRGPRPIAEATAMTLLATIATAPIAAAHFGTASVASLPANVLAAPVVAPIMWLGFIDASVGQFSPGLGALLGAFAAPLLGYLTWLAGVAAQWPGASLNVGWAPVAAVSVVSLAWIVWRVRAAPEGIRRPHPAQIALFVTLVAGALLVLAAPARTPAPPPTGTLRVTALDVGQGDAILVQGGGASVLFDAGLPEAPTVTRLRQAGVDRLDAFVVTHADADHAGGAAELLRRVKIGMLVDGRGGADLPEPGQEIVLGQLVLRVLWPSRDALESGTPTNDRSIVIEARVGGRKALLTGDAESDVLTTLELGDVDILKVAHHGSNDELLPQLLQAVTPEVALISVGRGNDYGHPTAATLAALKGVEVHRTDEEGTVSADASPEGITVRRIR